MSINPSKGERPFTQRSPNTKASTVYGRKDACRVSSGDLAGPSPRPRLLSGSKLCGQCGTDLSCSDCWFYRKQPKRYFAAKELPEWNRFYNTETQIVEEIGTREVKDLRVYLQLIWNLEDKMALDRIINRPLLVILTLNSESSFQLA